MNQDVITRALENFKEQYGGTRDALRSMQPTPMGTVERSQREQKALWKRMRALPKEDFNSLMDVAAQKAGHQQGEKPLCAVCQYILENAGDG